MKRTILRCGRCGVFCDNFGNEFLPTKQLIAADEIVGFKDSIGLCSKCRGSSIMETMEHEQINEMLEREKAKHLG